RDDVADAPPEAAHRPGAIGRRRHGAGTRGLVAARPRSLRHGRPRVAQVVDPRIRSADSDSVAYGLGYRPVAAPPLERPVVRAGGRRRGSRNSNRVPKPTKSASSAQNSLALLRNRKSSVMFLATNPAMSDSPTTPI